MHLSIWVYIALMTVLTIAALFDILNNHIIPLIIPVIGFVVRFIELVLIEPQMIKEYILISILIFIILFLLCYFGNLGGADCLLGSICALYVGLYSLLGILLAFMLALPYTINMKKHDNEHEYAFIPYIWIGMMVVILLKIKGGI